jgi:hypothetical protein
MYGRAYGRRYLFCLCVSHITDLPFMKGRLGIDYPELVVVRSGCFARQVSALRPPPD